MAETYSVSLEKLIEQMELENVHIVDSASE